MRKELWQHWEGLRTTALCFLFFLLRIGSLAEKILEVLGVGCSQGTLPVDPNTAGGLSLRVLIFHFYSLSTLGFLVLSFQLPIPSLLHCCFLKGFW